MSDKDILQSAKNIQNYCLNRKCDDCPFLFATGKGLEKDGCALNYPAQWQDLKDWDKYLDDESEAEKKVKAIEIEHSCVSCKFGNLYSDSEPCCNCTDDNDMFEPIESEVTNES